MATTNFTLRVPRNIATPISQVIATLSMIDENAVTCTITDPQLSPHTFSAISAPTPPSADSQAAFTYPAPADIPRNDRVTIVRRAAAAGDPRRRTIIVTFNLRTDFDPEASCVSSMPGAFEEWQISVAGSQIDSICQISYTRTSAGGCIGENANVPIVSNNPADLATINGQANQSCGIDTRAPADIYLVLDRSGSMSSTWVIDGVPMSRMQVLHEAVQTFVNTWDRLAVAGDRIGIVTFDDLFETPPFIGAGLQPFNSAMRDTVFSNIGTITDRGMTSIGGGIKLATDPPNGISSAPTTRRRIVLLMSDGLQNTNPFLGVTPPPAPNLPPTYDVFTYNALTPAVRTPLAGLSAATPYQIYTITVGPASGVDAAINNNVAIATGGFYINTEDANKIDQLPLFFLALLGNFLRFNSWETARLIQGQVSPAEPYKTSLPIATTTQRVVFSLSWLNREAVLRLLVFSPVGKEFEVVQEAGRAELVIDPADLTDPLSDWVVVVERVNGKDKFERTSFNLVALVEDQALKSDLRIVSADYQAGDLIELEAHISAFSEPTTGMAASKGDALLVQVVRPGQGVGDLLAGSGASTAPPNPNDRSGPTQSQLDNELAQNPDALQRNTNNPDIVELREREPGVYVGSYQSNLPGHYNFLFGVEGMSNGSGRFSRQEIKTVSVRATPNAEATEVQTSVRGNVLSVGLTPRTRVGSLMGPGWANYFWLTAPGVAPVKLRDSGKGGYSATMSFSGDTPPPVTLHFVDVLQTFSPEVTADRLPIPLGERTSLIPTLPGTGESRDDVNLRGCLIQLVRLLITIARLSIKVFERILKGLGG